MELVSLTAPEITEPTPPKQLDIKFVPVSILSSPIALFGLSITWKKTIRLYEFHRGWEALSKTLFCVSAFCLLTVIFVYIVKYVKAKPKVLEEWRDTQKFHLFANFTLSFVLLSSFFNEFESTKPVASTFWHIGSITHILFAVLTIRCWMHTKIELSKITPLYFFPFMTNFVPAFIGPTIENTSNELAWFNFTVAFVFYGSLFVIYVLVIVTSNLFPVTSPTEDEDTPSQSILSPNAGLLLWLVVPFCVGSIGYTHITGHYDYFAMALYFAGLFNFMVCVACADELINNGNPFTIGWHATTFPIVAVASSTLDFYHFRHYNTDNESPVVKAIALLGVWLASAFVIGVWIATIKKLVRKEIFVGPPKASELLVKQISPWLIKHS